MPLVALLLALAAAAVHASWNLILARSRDVHAATAAAVAIGAVAWLPALLAEPRIEGRAVPFLGGRPGSSSSTSGCLRPRTRGRRLPSCTP